MKLKQWGQLTATLRKGESGQATIMIAVMLAGLLAFTGFVLDFGQVTNKHRQTQNAADGAAQAAATDIYLGHSITSATNAANITMTNHGYTSSNLIQLLFEDKSYSPTTDVLQVRYVHSVVRETFNTFLLAALAPLFGSTLANPSVSAVATVKVAPGKTPCVLCVLDPHKAGAFTGNGNGKVTVTGGNIAVNSDSLQAGILNGNSNVQVIVAGTGIVGGYVTNGNSQFTPTPMHSTPVYDPLINVQDPLSAGLCGTGMGSQSVQQSTTLSPGTYGSISVGGQAVLTLNPGVYCVTGPFQTTGGGSITGTGVMLYFLCGSSSNPTACSTGGESGGSLSLTGNGMYSVSAPTSGQYQGLSIFYDRHNTSSLAMSGNGSDAFSGTIYAKDAPLTLTGNGTTFQVNSMIIADTVTMSGNGDINLAYDTTQDYQPLVPPVFTE